MWRCFGSLLSRLASKIHTVLVAAVAAVDFPHMCVYLCACTHTWICLLFSLLFEFFCLLPWCFSLFEQFPKLGVLVLYSQWECFFLVDCKRNHYLLDIGCKLWQSTLSSFFVLYPPFAAPVLIFWNFWVPSSWLLMLLQMYTLEKKCCADIAGSDEGQGFIAWSISSHAWVGFSISKKAC